MIKLSGATKIKLRNTSESFCLFLEEMEKKEETFFFSVPLDFWTRLRIAVKVICSLRAKKQIVIFVCLAFLWICNVSKTRTASLFFFILWQTFVSFYSSIMITKMSKKKTEQNRTEQTRKKKNQKEKRVNKPRKTIADAFHGTVQNRESDFDSGDIPSYCCYKNHVIFFFFFFFFLASCLIYVMVRGNPKLVIYPPPKGCK